MALPFHLLIWSVNLFASDAYCFSVQSTAYRAKFMEGVNKKIGVGWWWGVMIRSRSFLHFSGVGEVMDYDTALLR